MKWLSRLFVLLLGCLVVLAVVLAMFPARTAVQWFGDRLGQVQLRDISGTIWRGHAERVEVRGTQIGALAWHVRPWSLLSMRPAGDAALEGQGYRLRSDLELTDRQTLRLLDARGAFPAERLNPALDIPGLVPVGEVEFNVEEAVLVAGFPRSLRGEVVWKKAAVAGEAAANFGDLVATFHTDQAGVVQGIVGDRGGPLSVDGTFTVSVRGYEAEVILFARDGNPDVIKALRWIGEPLDDGSSLLKIEGRILPL
ncbi:MAG: type II secretion system protein N [Xanthomonadales bacterium]|nr:type II secretion system protein N [Xanthomonadales bacterium]